MAKSFRGVDGGLEPEPGSMAETLLDQLKNRLESYLEAEASALKMQEYTFEQRQVKRAKLSEISSEIGKINEQIAQLSQTGSRIRIGVPVW
jgi:hypothetical protein